MAHCIQILKGYIIQTIEFDISQIEYNSRPMRRQKEHIMKITSQLL